MAFAATVLATEPRAFSIGPVKAQVFTWSTISGDTSGTITTTSLHSISHILIDGGLTLTAAPTFSSGVVTLAFNDPVASLFGTAIVYGK